MGFYRKLSSQFYMYVFVFIFTTVLLQYFKSRTKLDTFVPLTHNNSVTRRLDNEHVKQDLKQRLHFVFPDFRRKSVLPLSCPLLFSGNSSEQKRAMIVKRVPKQLDYYQKQAKNCEHFKEDYITHPLTQEEKDFPIAYSILVYKDLAQVERLLRAIYRPQNYYCIHIDLKADRNFRKTLSLIANCFENVFITKISVNVQWGTFTVLEPELVCMEELWKYKTWKYFINLTGQEFPLRTNGELVKVLKIYNGTNDVSGTVKRANKQRWAKAGKPPAGILPGKGSVHITVNRHYVDYILHNQTAHDFLDWCNKTSVPDETYFASLNHNPQLGIRGSVNGYVEPYIMNSRFKNWGNLPCGGKVVRQICIFGIEDLPVLFGRSELFANKFYWDFQPLTLDCMEELLYNRTRDGYLNKMKFNSMLYENLQFLKNRT
ncbi:beta-1,3-galactosyl-O-glycosyl-glycoprotein beta-1,6-N-acetylglucosaminyltransferase-like [Pecten maximus]|uniref:beta-1,3-galactosyl-O-glycosyl-glycoprotein beta-1,6-N-acetylglucosaminyltransferase-like n=1 Tax=Pecten maximus TaxID=6579 RepID=UPI0014585303|nr:beta-1,3-galactosyl-O-glycosyl-glycoprotein beta-1,6-N-acetylglucosaminyltransferase-like [Pecten maximus]